MVLFISLYPRQSNEKEGMLQRVAAIDKVFEKKKRVYIQISYKRHLLPKVEHLSDCLTVYTVNLYLHFWLILFLAFKSNGIYVQSIYNSIRVLPLYFFFDMITDLHGLVPEELAYEGRTVKGKWYGFVESIAVRKSKAVVTVTNAMSEYVRRKYSVRELQVFNIPIFDLSATECSTAVSEESRLRVIYAGGAQKWQNVEMMLETIKETEGRYEYTILTGDLDVFRGKLSALGLLDAVKLLSVRKQEVYSYYAASDLGFLLRDDIALNNVACPTKLIEYMSQGIVPIVIQPSIGDFAALGYSYILLRDFVQGKMPSSDEINDMKNNNFKIVEQLKQEVMSNVDSLLTECGGD